MYLHKNIYSLFISIQRCPINKVLGTVDYIMRIQNSEESVTKVITKTFCAGWLMIGKERELDEHAVRELHFMIDRLP